MIYRSIGSYLSMVAKSPSLELRILLWNEQTSQLLFHYTYTACTVVQIVKLQLAMKETMSMQPTA